MLTPPDRHGSFVSTGPAGLRNDTPPMRLWRKAERLGVWNPDDIDFGRRMQRIERARGQTLDEVYEVATADAESS
jgi:hypothetical protein